MGTKFFGTICPGGPNLLGTVFPGGPNCLGTISPWGPNFFVTICPLGQEVGNRKSVDQMGPGPNESQQEKGQA